jgi:general secretion pathway protein D
LIRRLSAAVSAIALVGLAACRSGPPQLAPLPELKDNAGIAAPRINGTVDQTAASPPPVLEAGTKSHFALPPPLPGQSGGDVTLDFADTDIREIAKQVLGTILKVNFTIDPSVHGTATIETMRPISRADLLPTLETLLNQNGATMIQTGSLFRVVPSAVAAVSPSLGSASTEGSEIVTLNYASAKDLEKVLKPYVGDGVRLVSDPARNTLVVSGEPPARAAVIGLIHSFDTDLLAGQSYGLFPVTSGEPAKVAAELQKVFQTEGDGSLAGVVRVIPMDRVNAVLIVSNQQRYIDDARRLFQLVESGRQATARSWHVYYVQNGRSDDIANVLQRAFTPNNVTAKPDDSAGATAPGQGQGGIGQSSGFGSSSFGGSSGSGIGAGTSTLGGLGSSGQQSTGASVSQPVRAAGGGDDGGGATDSLGGGGSDDNGGKSANSIRIIPNKTNNAVLIYATPEEESTVESMLHRIDIMPLQVRIDATIAEVTLTDDLQYGTQFSFKADGIEGLLSNLAGGTISNLSGLSPGFSVSRIGKAGNAQGVIAALASITKVRVLSSPQVMVLDNQTARLQVGNLVPYLTGTAQSTLTSTSEVVNSVSYQETGVILEVVPRVNSGGLVTLDVSQEVSDATNTNSSGIDSPTFDERKIQSRVAVQDGQTIGIAGLIRDTVSQGNSGIPFIKDIPLLGTIFSNQNNTRDRTELLVLLTPHVVQDQRQARALTEDLRQGVIEAGLVPQQLQALPLQGKPNPNAVLPP